ncbi:unnamed protein product [Heterobilharzia americana]|nr:unnamed protein product [Heterobilharzia americana]
MSAEYRRLGNPQCDPNLAPYGYHGRSEVHTVRQTSHSSTAPSEYTPRGVVSTVHAVSTDLQKRHPHHLAGIVVPGISSNLVHLHNIDLRNCNAGGHKVSFDCQQTKRFIQKSSS